MCITFIQLNKSWEQRLLRTEWKGKQRDIKQVIKILWESTMKSRKLETEGILGMAA